MKVLMIGNHRAVHGGITSVISQILEHDWEEENIRIRFIPTYAGGGSAKKIIYYVIAYVRIIFEMVFNTPDIVYMHMSHHGSFDRKYHIHRLCKFFEKPDIIHLHGSEFKKWYYEISGKKQEKVRRLLAESDSFIVLGEKWKKTITDIEPKAKVVVVNNTVQIPPITCHWDQKTFQVLFLGVLVERKGVADLLYAVNKMPRSEAGVKLKVIIAGSGEEQSNLEKIVRETKLESVVTFAGWTDGIRKKELLEKSQMLVLPSYNEGLPIAILEALSYGLPVIATDVGDVSIAVRDNINGYLISPGDVNALSSAIYRIMSNKALYEKMSQESRKIAVEEFNEDRYFGTLKEVFNNVRLKAD